MKYYTKEWYNLCQQCSYHYGLRISDKAAVFSDKYYQTLYKRKLNEFLKSEKRMSELTADDIYGVDSGRDDFKVIVEDSEITKEDCLQSAGDIRKQMLDARANFVPPIYNEEELIRTMEDNHKSYIEELKNIIPTEILENIVDIRVFALGITTKSVKKDIRTWCRKNSKETKRISEECRKVHELNMNDIGIDILRTYGFHDCRIIGLECNGDDFIIELDTSGGFTYIDKVIFKNYSILEKEGELQGAIWLYQEIYPTSVGNEYHALVQRNDGELAYLTVVASDIEFKIGE